MTTPTIRDLCAALSGDVDYLIACIQDGSSDSCALQECLDRANAARNLLAAEPVGGGGDARCVRIELVTAIHCLASHFGIVCSGLSGDDLQKAKSDIAHAKSIAAKHNQNGPGCPQLSPAAPPAPEPPAEALAARPLLEKMARLANRGGVKLLGEITAISGLAAAWLRDNPPGQPVAIEPRGCPTPGACSCVEPAPAAPEPGEVGSEGPLSDFADGGMPLG